MKTSYYLFTVAGLAAAAAVVYTQYPGLSGAHESPTVSLLVPLGAEPAPAPFGPGDLSLPPIVTPPDGQLAIPVVPSIYVPPTPIPAPSFITPISVPALPPSIPLSPPLLPVPPAAVPVPPPLLPVPPVMPLTSIVPAAPALPSIPGLEPRAPSAPPIAPVPTPVLPKPAPLPVPATPATPPLLPPPVGSPVTPLTPLPGTVPTPIGSTPIGKFVVLKNGKLLEGTVTAAGDNVFVKQGSLERPFLKADVLFIADSKDEVYRTMLARVPTTDAAARLGVARWCLFAGLREHALTEAREVLKLHPGHAAATEMARSLDESLKLFPADGSTPVIATKPAGGGTLVSVDADPEVTPEGASSFVSRAQAVLANQCMECHARPDYAGAFKLTRVTGFEAGPQTIKANLRATASQLKRDDPGNSPLLVKSLSIHGGMKQPAFVSRQSAGFRVLEAWVGQAAMPVVAPMTSPTQPAFGSATPAMPAVPTPPMPVPVAPQVPVVPLVPAIPPAAVLPPVPQVPLVPAIPPAAVLPVLPTVPAAPMIPAAPPVVPAPPSIPLSPDVEPTPVALPPLPALPQVPAVLPTPPSMPPAETTPKVLIPVPPTPIPVPVPPVPAVLPTPVLPIPQAAIPKPALPPALPPAGQPVPSEFGEQAPVKPAPSGPVGGDEFDPDQFNKAPAMGK